MQISKTTWAAIIKVVAAILTLLGAYLTGEVALAAVIGGAVQAIISGFGLKVAQDAPAGSNGAARPKAGG